MAGIRKEYERHYRRIVQEVRQVFREEMRAAPQQALIEVIEQRRLPRWMLQHPNLGPGLITQVARDIFYGSGEFDGISVPIALPFWRIRNPVPPLNFTSRTICRLKSPTIESILQFIEAHDGQATIHLAPGWCLVEFEAARASEGQGEWRTIQILREGNPQEILQNLQSRYLPPMPENIFRSFRIYTEGGWKQVGLVGSDGSKLAEMEDLEAGSFHIEPR